MLRHATREALRGVARGCRVPRRAHGFDLARLAAPSPEPEIEDAARPARRCSSCGGEFVPVRRDARYCTRVECGRARAAERRRRRKECRALQSPTEQGPGFAGAPDSAGPVIDWWFAYIGVRTRSGRDDLMLARRVQLQRASPIPSRTPVPGSGTNVQPAAIGSNRRPSPSPFI